MAALRDTPAVYLQGPRQAGKSTLSQALRNQGYGAEYFTLDDAATLAAAQSDPDGFVGGLPERVILDEVQRVPELFRAIKRSVDTKRKPGRFLLTGSAHALVLPKVSESLAGRMEVLTLWPFSQGEIGGRKEGFVDACFARDFKMGKFTDTGWPLLTERSLLCHLLGLDAARLQEDDLMTAAALECFVAGELTKQISWSETRPGLFHYRTHTQQEVDFVLEDRSGRLVGIEVKKTAGPTSNDFKGLRHLADQTGKRFLRGILLYTGASSAAFDSNLHAVPVSSLWQLEARLAEC